MFGGAEETMKTVVAAWADGWEATRQAAAAPGSAGYDFDSAASALDCAFALDSDYGYDLDLDSERFVDVEPVGYDSSSTIYL